jgi:hypothetical protein
MDPITKERISDRSIWVRALYALFFTLAYTVSETVLTLVVIFQFLAALITGRVNDALLRFGANLSQYVYQILQFVTFNNETLPFPFSDWPDVEPGNDSPWIGGTNEEDSQPQTETEEDNEDSAAEEYDDDERPT